MSSTTIPQDHDPRAAADLAPDDDADSQPGAEGTDEPTSARRVPVAESIRYRRRAQAAEQRLAELQAKFDQAADELRRTRTQLESVERRQRIDQLLIESDAVDLEAARLLTELAVSRMEPADVKLAVDDLKKRKPFLFRRPAPAISSMAARPRGDAPAQLADIAQAAAATGDRRQLLKYLRLRRKP
jgi:hypothetical protein